jgi:hypothetical protein
MLVQQDREFVQPPEVIGVSEGMGIARRHRQCEIHVERTVRVGGVVVHVVDRVRQVRGRL